MNAALIRLIVSLISRVTELQARAEKAEKERDEAVAGKYQAPEIELAREEGRWAAAFLEAEQRAEQFEGLLREWKAARPYADADLDARTSIALSSVSDDPVEEVVQRAAQVPCVMVQSDPDAATCRSPVAGEGRPRDRWCLYCVARDVLSSREGADR